MALLEGGGVGLGGVKSVEVAGMGPPDGMIGIMAVVLVPFVDLLKYFKNICGDMTSSEGGGTADPLVA